MTRRHHNRPARPTRSTHERSASAAAMISIFDGRQCIGHVLCRGRMGFEAFNGEDVSLGVFANQKDAIAAINGTTDEHQRRRRP
jgi:hypothetical protein